MKRQRKHIALIGILVLVLAGCSAEPANVTTMMEETPEQTAADQSTGGTISASGRVTPENWTVLSFSLLGPITYLPVSVGDVVQEGDLLAQLDTAELDAALAQAEAALMQAEANLANVQAGPSEEEVAAAEWAVTAAEARVSAAAAQRSALYSTITEADIADAESQLYNAQLQYNEALENLQDLQEFDPEDCDIYEEETEIPESFSDDDIPPEIQEALQDYFGVVLPDNVDTPEGRRDLEILADQVRASACPLSHYQEAANYYELASLGLEAAQAYLDALLEGPTSELVAIENARVWAASTQVSVAQARLDNLLAQPYAEEVAIAAAGVMQAQAGVDAVRALLSRVELRAPFDATVTGVYADANELAIPGQPVLQLGDLTHLRVETSDLNELDVVRITEGSIVHVTFEALPDIEVQGRITTVSPRLEDGPGVNYTVIIDLDEIPQELRWGMTAYAEIEMVR